MKLFLYVFIFILLSSAFAQKELTGVRPVTEGDSPVLGIPHDPLVEEGDSEPSWLFLEIPMDAAFTNVTPDGVVLGKIGEVWHRWRPGQLPERLSMFPHIEDGGDGETQETTAAMNRRGDVVCRYMEISYSGNHQEVDTVLEYWPIEGGLRLVDVPSYYEEEFDWDDGELYTYDTQEARLERLDDLGTLWVDQYDGLAGEILGRSLVGGAVQEPPIDLLYASNALGSTAGFAYPEDGGVFKHYWDSVEVGESEPHSANRMASGFRVAALNNWGVALATNGVHWPDGRIDPIPVDTYVDGTERGSNTYLVDSVDELGRPRGIDPSTGIEAVWNPAYDELGTLVSYDRDDYVPAPVPEGWTTDLKIAPGEILPQVGTATNGTRTVNFLLLPIYPHIVGDNNRDGIIDDKDKELILSDNYIWRRWINDDNDESDWEGDNIPERAEADCLNLVVDGLRDLEDFFPLSLEIRNVVEAYAPTDYQYFLKHDDDAFNFLETDLVSYNSDSDAAAKAYLHRPDIAEVYGSSQLQRIDADGALLSDSFLEKIEDQSASIILVEGVHETEKPLRLEIVEKATSNVVFSIQFPVKITGVESMFKLANLVDRIGYG